MRLSGENVALGLRLSDAGLSPPGDVPLEKGVKRRCCRTCGIVTIDVAAGVLLVTGLLMLYATIYLDTGSDSHWLWKQWMALFGASIGNVGMSEAGNGFASQASTSCDSTSTLDCDAKQ